MYIICKGKTSGGGVLDPVLHCMSKLSPAVQTLADFWEKNVPLLHTYRTNITTLLFSHFEFLKQVESKRSQFEISLSRQHALIKTQFTIKESFKLSLAGSKGYTFSITSSFLCNDNSQRTVKGNSVRCKNELFSC